MMFSAQAVLQGSLFLVLSTAIALGAAVLCLRGLWRLGKKDRLGAWYCLISSPILIGYFWLGRYLFFDQRPLRDLSIDFSRFPAKGHPWIPANANCYGPTQPGSHQTCISKELNNVALMLADGLKLNFVSVDFSYELDAGTPSALMFRPTANLASAKALEALAKTVSEWGGASALDEGSAKRYELIRERIAADQELGSLAGTGVCARRTSYSLCLSVRDWSSSWGGRVYGIDYDVRDLNVK